MKAVQAIVLDIEGTTTPIAFVYQVLFPFVRRRLGGYLRDPENRDLLREPLQRLREERQADADQGQPKSGRDPGIGDVDPAKPLPGTGANPGVPAPSEPGEAAESIGAYVTQLMDEDRKSPGLKLLQGEIWKEGYRSGELKGELFADVAPALQRWGDAGLAVAIYSSGSELAQRLLFGSTASGDLTPRLVRFFDTSAGPKQVAESYRRIASELGTSPDRLLFISDVTKELDAASAAGCQVVLCVRPGNPPQPAHPYPVIDSFDEVERVIELDAPVERTRRLPSAGPRPK